MAAHQVQQGNASGARPCLLAVIQLVEQSVEGPWPGLFTGYSGPMSEKLMAAHRTVRIDWHLQALAWLCALVAAISPLWQPVNHGDLAWFLLVGEAQDNGLELYVDVRDPNPPLFHWINAIAAAGARHLGASTHLVFFGFLVVWTLLLLPAMWRTSHQLFPLSPRRAALLFAAIPAISFLVEPYNIGQRDQIALFSVMPYLLALGVRAREQPLPIASIAAVGTALAFACALRPLYLLLPLATEILLLRVRHWRWQVLLRPEVLLAGLVFCLLCPLPALLDPNYAAFLNTYGELYFALHRLEPSSRALLVIAALLSLLPAAVRAGSAQCFAAQAAWVAALMALASVFVQGKWLPYQVLLVEGLAALAALLIVLLEAPAGRSRSWRVCQVLALVWLAWLLVVAYRGQAAQIATQWDLRPDQKELAANLEAAAPGGTIAVFGYYADNFLPAIYASSLRWDSPDEWQWPVAAASLIDAPAEKERWLQRLRTEAVERLIARAPDVLGLQVSGPAGTGVVQDYRAYLGEDPRFPSFLEGYEPLTWLSGVQFYRTHQ